MSTLPFPSVRCLLLALVVSLSSSLPASAAVDPAYVRTTNERADKIVSQLSLSDAAKATRVRDAIAQFYRDLNATQTTRDTAIKAAKEKTDASKDARDADIKAARDKADAERTVLHQGLVEKLGAELTPAQVDQVKDGLTYGVVPLTFRVYQEMLPTLTVEEKAQIHAWLLEAREHAMDGFTSEEKHGWFGKYKGRINNYLAKAGYNMKEAEKEMAARQKAAH